MKAAIISSLALGLLLAAGVTQVGAQQTLLPAPAPSVNGQPLSVFKLTLLSSDIDFGGSGQVAWPQSFPAAASASVPPEINNVQEDPPDTGFTTITPPPTTPPTVSDYSCATSRPDFKFLSGKLNFEKTATSGLPQKDMNFGAGLPTGTKKFVPVGEF